MTQLATINTWMGDLASSTLTGCSFPAHAVAKIYNKGTKADIKISLKLETFKTQTTNVFTVFNSDVLKSICDGKAVNFSPIQTSALLFENGVNPVSDDYGKTGLGVYLNPSTGTFCITRVYNDNFDWGSWGVNTTSIYKQGRYIIIDVIGATLS